MALTFSSKLNEATILRFLAFFVFKSIFYLVSTYAFIYIIRTFFHHESDGKINLSFLDFLLFVFFSNLIDISKFFVFKEYQESYNISDQIFKILLDPGANTLHVLVGTVMNLFALRLIMSEVVIEESNDPYKSFYLPFGLISTTLFLARKENFTWPKIFPNLNVSFKYTIKKVFIEISNYVILIAFFFHFMTVFFDESERGILQLFCTENIVVFTFVYYFELLQSTSFIVLKGYVCSPIQLEKKGVEKLIKENIRTFDRYLVIHYYQSLYYTFERIYYSDKNNSFEKDYLSSSEALNEVLLKMNNIQNLYEKYGLVISKHNNNNSLFSRFSSNNLNFDSIFTKFSSFESIEYISKCVPTFIQILSKNDNKKLTGILQLFELIILLEKFLKDLEKNKLFVDYLIRNKRFESEFYEMMKNVSRKINFVNSEIIRRKIVPTFGETVKFRLAEYANCFNDN